jgi:anti-anti-sigma regulatory factor
MDLELVDALARLQLVARRRGLRLWLRNVPPDLTELLQLCGLGEILGVETRRQPEHREVAGGVQEEGDARDPVA